MVEEEEESQGLRASPTYIHLLVFYSAVLLNEKG